MFHHSTWAVGSYSSGPSAGGTPQILVNPTKVREEMGHPVHKACPDVSIMKSKLNFSLFRRGGGQTASDVVPSLRGRLRLLRSDAPLRPVQRKRAGGLLRFEEEAARAGDAPLRRLIT